MPVWVRKKVQEMPRAIELNLGCPRHTTGSPKRLERRAEIAATDLAGILKAMRARSEFSHWTRSPIGFSGAFDPTDRNAEEAGVSHSLNHRLLNFEPAWSDGALAEECFSESSASKRR
jgi:hypothetical protein